MQLSLTPLDWIVCLSTLVGSIVFGLYLSVRFKSGENSESFFLAGRRLKWPIVGASIYSTNIGADHVVGLTGDAYRYGLCAGTVELTTAICMGITAGILLPCYLKNKVFTIPGFLERRYDPLARTFFSGLMLLICILTKMAFVLYAGALVLHTLLGYDIMTTVAIVGVVAAIITVIGGFAAVAYTDSIQTAIIVVRFKPGLSEKAQVSMGRLFIWITMVLGVISAYFVYKTPHGLFMYLQAISFYLIVPVIPAIAWGIFSKKPTFHGAVISILTGFILSIFYVADLFIGEDGSKVFPWLHYPLTENYTYRGTTQFILVSIILFIAPLSLKKLILKNLSTQHLIGKKNGTHSKESPTGACILLF